MIGDLFDSPWKILIVALVIIVLFGSKKLPSAARSLGQSMRILKKEVQGLHEDEPESSPRALRHLPRSPSAPQASSRPSGCRSTRCSSRSVTCSGRPPWTPRRRRLPQPQPRPLVRPGSPSSRAWRTAGLRS